MFQFNLTHHINHLSFGEPYPGVHNPLDNTVVPAEESKLLLAEIESNFVLFKSLCLRTDMMSGNHAYCFNL